MEALLGSAAPCHAEHADGVTHPDSPGRAHDGVGDPYARPSPRRGIRSAETPEIRLRLIPVSGVPLDIPAAARLLHSTQFRCPVESKPFQLRSAASIERLPDIAHSRNGRYTFTKIFFL
jgi:hypothetical protein